MTHPTWELSVDSGALILTPCPGTKETDLIDSLIQLKSQGVSAIITAISHQEMSDAGVAKLAQQAQNLGLIWFHHPIEDDLAPDALFLEGWRKTSPEIHNILNAGHKVALHCMGGSGRTGLLAFHLLHERNWPLEEIIQQVQHLRPNAFTKPAQHDYIQDFVD